MHMYASGRQGRIFSYAGGEGVGTAAITFKFPTTYPVLRFLASLTALTLNSVSSNYSVSFPNLLLPLPPLVVEQTSDNAGNQAVASNENSECRLFRRFALVVRPLSARGHAATAPGRAAPAQASVKLTLQPPKNNVHRYHQHVLLWLLSLFATDFQMRLEPGNDHGRCVWLWPSRASPSP